MNDREKIEELKALFKNGLEIAYGIYPQRMNSLLATSADHALAYEKLNKLVQGMTELSETVGELLMLTRPSIARK